MEYVTNDRKPIVRMIDTFKEIRQLRQHPAHVIEDDVFDQIYFKKQRELIIDAYNGVRILRLILANHPAVRGYKVPDYLQSGRIWSY